MMAWLAAVLISLLGISAVPVDRGVVSMYRPWKKGRWVPNARYPGRWSAIPTKHDLVCAHRTLPFGTVLILTRDNAPPGVCVVLDRGPFGYCLKVKGSRTKLSRNCPVGHKYTVAVGNPAAVRRWEKRDGFYRGVVDATPAVHRLMRSDGWTKVKVARIVGLGRLMRVLRLTDFGAALVM